jgi:hypothetical protein
MRSLSWLHLLEVQSFRQTRRGSPSLSKMMLPKDETTSCGGQKIRLTRATLIACREELQSRAFRIPTFVWVISKVIPIAPKTTIQIINNTISPILGDASTSLCAASLYIDCPRENSRCTFSLICLSQSAALIDKNSRQNHFLPNLMHGARSVKLSGLAPSSPIDGSSRWKRSPDQGYTTVLTSACTLEEVRDPWTACIQFNYVPRV